MHFFEFIKKNSKLLLVFIIIFFVILLLVGVYYIDSSNKSTQQALNIATQSDLKGFDAVKPKINNLLSSPNVTIDMKYKIVRNLNILEDKKNPEKVRYAGLLNVDLYFNEIYSDTNDPKFRSISTDLSSFAKLDFPKLYDWKIFSTSCQDPSCAEAPQPKEILQMINEVEKSDFPSYIKQQTIQGLKDPGFLPKNLKMAKAQNYYYVLTNLKNFSNFSPSGVNKKIYNELNNYLQVNYPDELTQILKDVKVYESKKQ